ncbi:hypothetical protein E2562_011221 [Oryza meyeriana var. granulata]|uniref:Uncharacterized protein n=1 Tax=Oryza meyeriana var. granulata TaxID=110450 RepID=A0A6G1DGS4_9ORYZ|nr:hypothetical protein E2562_011221 [Oryza meyeriana var. granulata]
MADSSRGRGRLGRRHQASKLPIYLSRIDGERARWACRRRRRQRYSEHKDGVAGGGGVGWHVGGDEDPPRQARPDVQVDVRTVGESVALGFDGKRVRVFLNDDQPSASPARARVPYELDRN